MSRIFNLLLLLLYFINHIDSSTVGNILIHVTGQKGENATLPCDIGARDIFNVILYRQSDPILKCENDKCKGEDDRVFKTGSCDITIKDLRLSDAGRYILRVYYTDDHRELKYYLQIHGEISVKTGEQLKMDVLLINADKVEKNSSGEWTEVWTRGHGVSSDRLTDSNETLTIKEFRANDTGTYRVLDSNNETLITVTVTESGPESVGGQQGDTEHTAVYWFLCVGLPVLLVLIPVGVIAFVVFKKPQCQNITMLLAGPPENIGIREPIITSPKGPLRSTSGAASLPKMGFVDG